MAGTEGLQGLPRITNSGAAPHNLPPPTRCRRAPFFRASLRHSWRQTGKVTDRKGGQAEGGQPQGAATAAAAAAVEEEEKEEEEAALCWDHFPTGPAAGGMGGTAALVGDWPEPKDLADLRERWARAGAAGPAPPHGGAVRLGDWPQHRLGALRAAGKLPRGRVPRLSTGSGIGEGRRQA